MQIPAKHMMSARKKYDIDVLFEANSTQNLVLKDLSNKYASK